MTRLPPAASMTWGRGWGVPVPHPDGYCHVAVAELDTDEPRAAGRSPARPSAGPRCPTPFEASAAGHAQRSHVAGGALVVVVVVSLRKHGAGPGPRPPGAATRTVSSPSSSMSCASWAVASRVKFCPRSFATAMATSAVARSASPSSFPTASMSPPASWHATLMFLGAAARDVHFHQGAAASQGRDNAVGVTPQLQRSERVARRRGRGIIRSHNAIKFTPLRGSGSNTTLDRNYLDQRIRIVSPLRNDGHWTRYARSEAEAEGRRRGWGRQEHGERGVGDANVGGAAVPAVPVEHVFIVCIDRRVVKLSVERKGVPSLNCFAVLESCGVAKAFRE
jgi:hypothetical protein